MKRLYFLAFGLSLYSGLITMVPSANAQSVAATSCSSFKDAEKDPARQALFLAYLQGYANASSPDPRYTKSDAALADDVKKVQEWCGKNSKSTYAEAVAAVLGLPAHGKAGQAAPATADPTSCRVGPTIYCAGCSVTCTGGKQAKCWPGSDSGINKWCTAQARCICK